MIYTDLAGRYFDWLYERVCGDWEPRGLSFHRLLTFLYNQNFTPSCELDGARAEDGLDLRYRFAQTQNIVYQDVQDAFAGIPCSMLEMMVALSIRIEEHILEDAASGNRVGQWFWNMVVSLGLVAMDDTRFNEERAQSVLDRFNAREYQPNGAGGLFTLMHPKEDGRMHNMFRGTDLGLGGYVYAEPGMYWNVALLDVASLHPHSAVAMNYFGEYTKNFNDLMDVRIYVKHKEYDKAKKLFGGKLAKYLDDPAQAKALAQALKIAINSVYGLTSATFDNPFRNPKNANNIVALRGALFMRTLQDEVQQRGFKVAHIKTDSIKIPGATPEIIDFCMKFAEKYGYQFEHEATYEKMCLVNNAVYIARYMDAADCKARYGYVPGDNEKEGGEWTATGTQFQVPYVFKTLFSHEDIVFNDLCETKSVSKGAIYLDKNEDLAEGEHNYIFIGRVGQFCPIKPGCGGALLVREAGAKDNGETKYDSVTGAKDYRWLESEMVYNLHLEDTIDRSYFDKMATKAIEAISEYGDFEQFASNDLGEPPWQKPDIPWDDVQDEAAQNFNVR